MMKDVHDFWKYMVEPALVDRYVKPLDERRLRDLIGHLNSLVDWNYKTDHSIQQSYKRVNKYRSYLCANNRNLLLIRDIANGTKHCVLSKGHRIVSRADSLSLKEYVSLGEVERTDNLSSWDCTKEWGVDDDNNNWIPIEQVLAAAVRFWKLQLGI
ncbi:MAG: hypothetical protein U1E38_06660 [Rhodospirillales bacterium]